MNQLLSRKFIFAASVTILGFWLVLAKFANSDEWFKFVEVIGGILELEASTLLKDFFTARRY